MKKDFTKIGNSCQNLVFVRRSNIFDRSAETCPVISEPLVRANPSFLFGTYLYRYFYQRYEFSGDFNNVSALVVSKFRIFFMHISRHIIYIFFADIYIKYSRYLFLHRIHFSSSWFNVRTVLVLVREMSEQFGKPLKWIQRIKLVIFIDGVV